MPTAFKHALIALAQYALLTLAAAAAGAFTLQESSNEFLGHVGPGTLLVASGVLAMAGPRDERRAVSWEGGLAVLAGVGYVAADTFYAHPPWGVFDGAGQAEQFHVGFMSLVAVAGILAVVFVRTLGRPTGLHALLLAAAFTLFVTGHHQHSEASALSHNACALFALLAAGFRVMGRRVEYGICIIAAAYLFFSGQLAFAGVTAAWRIQPVAWVSVWTALGLLVGTAYLAAFGGAAREASEASEPGRR